MLTDFFMLDTWCKVQSIPYDFGRKFFFNSFALPRESHQHVSDQNYGLISSENALRSLGILLDATCD